MTLQVKKLFELLLIIKTFKKQNWRLWGSHLSPAMFDFFNRKNTNNLECNGDDLMLPSSRVDVLISKNTQIFFWKNTTDERRRAYIKLGPPPLGLNIGSVPSPTPAL